LSAGYRGARVPKMRGKGQRVNAEREGRASVGAVTPEKHYLW